MTPRPAPMWLAALTTLATGLLLAAGAAAEQRPVDAFLGDISEAVNATNYQGTLMRIAGDRIDTLRVMHSNRDGVIREKLVAMDGEGREIIRIGDELICLLPGRRIKLVDTNSMPSNAFVRLPASAAELDRFYQLEAHGAERFVGRKALRYFIRPRDRYRYGHRLWIDAETSLPLRMQLVSGRRVIEEIRFANVEIGVEIADDVFASDIDSSEFRVIQASAANTTGAPPAASATSASNAADDDWPQEASPGFRLRTLQSQMVRINGRVAQRLVFSDGLATVSMFIDRQGDNPATRTQLASLGAAHSFQRQVNGKTLTLVGEVPVETLRMLAAQAERQLLRNELSVDVD